MAAAQYNGGSKHRVNRKINGPAGSMDLKNLENEIVSNHKKNVGLTQFDAYKKVLSGTKGKEPGDVHNKYEGKVVKRAEKGHK